MSFFCDELHQTTLEESYNARDVLSSTGTIRTPLVPLNWGSKTEKPLELQHLNIFLKLESLQPINSFKIRGAYNAIQQHTHRKENAKKEISSSSCTENGNSHRKNDDEVVAVEGFITASAGNMAQGVAWSAQQAGVGCLAVVPDNAPETKVCAIESLGGMVIRVPFAEWWNIILTSDPGNHSPGDNWHFIHPVCSQDVINGNSTIALEIIQDCPDVDVVIAPYGGGGLSCGIGSIMKRLRPNCKVYACEPTTAAPLAKSLAHGKPCTVDYKPSFIDGCGGKGILNPMWPLAKSVLDGSLVVTPEDTATTIRHLVEYNRVVAEGAGAVSVAAAMKGLAGTKGNVVCIVSGGGLNSTALVDILRGNTPGGA